MPERHVSFAPGPSMLPPEVVAAFRDAVTTYGATGLGILELGHRSSEFGRLLNDTIRRVRDLAEVPEGYEILVLHGGARMQFAMLPANLLAPDATADYVDSGYFAHDATTEAMTYGKIHAVGSSVVGYRQLPDPASHVCPTSPTYLHYTSNNTEAGTQYVTPPTPPPGAWLACDASSDLLTRSFDVNAHGVVYATAHKNLGTPGLSLVVIRQSLLKAVRDLPDYFRYEAHARAGSRFNTPPVVSVFTLNLMLRWIAGEGGVHEMTERSRVKAAMIYEALDSSDFFTALVEPGHRSLVNATFAAPSPDLERRFLVAAAREGMDGLWGYRKVGHLRASLFNAVTVQHCERLVEFMSSFAARHRHHA